MVASQKNTGAVAAPAQTPQPVAGEPQKAAVVPTLLNDRDFLFIQGEVTWLMGRSPRHRHLFVADFDWLVGPPLALKQARIFRNPNKPLDNKVAGAASSQVEGTPLAFVSWAFVSDEVNERLKSGVIRLQPAEWRSGPYPWIVDIVAPFGGAEQAVAEVVKQVFGGKVVPVAGGKPAVGGQE
jgi:cytolysin-activating lysine-acyltransferase